MLIMFSSRPILAALPLLAALVLPRLSAAPVLEIEPGDHIAIVGNALADRQQHFGWLESLIHQANPDKELVVRNLAFPGDEVERRARSDNFGTPEEWLKKVGADVIFAYFGFNESFHGLDSVENFRKQLDGWVKKTLAGTYGKKGPPRLVLFSPTAFENTGDPNLPEGYEHNPRLEAYTAAVAAVAEANQLPYVDLFQISREIYQKGGGPWTDNGVHFKDRGDRALAAPTFQALFGTAAASTDDPLVRKIRSAVLEKNREWYERYRTIDGYNIYGGRSELAYQPGKGGFITEREPKAPYLSNFQVMQEEMAERDVRTANRDKKVWAVARGADPATVVVDDSNVPPVQKVPTNIPGDLPDGLHSFLDGTEAISRMTLPEGVKCTLFADEKMFPELVNPVQMAWDTKGRLWVAVWRNYPERAPGSKIGDSLLIFEDTDNDGKADKCTHFADDLNAPTGFQFYKDGVIVVQAPNLLFLRDTDGDDRADTSEIVLMGLDSADSHHQTNSMCYEPGGAIYCSDGVFYRSQIETIFGPVRNIDGAIYRWEPLTAKFERYMAYALLNPHGRVFDYWGNDIITDATGNNSYFGPAASGFIDEPKKHRPMKEFWDRPSRPCAGTTLLSSRAWPEEYRDSFLNLNVISMQGCFRVKVTEEGSGLHGETQENLFSSSDPNFRPVAIDVAPDGSLYFLDWANAIIGHMQHHLRDPNRDQAHGRIYRLTHERGKLLVPAQIDGQPITALLELLKTPENNTRLRAKIELGKHDAREVTAAAAKWAAALDPGDPDYEHHRLEALWVHQWHNVVNEDLLRQVLASPEPRARAQAVRVLCYWRDRVPGALDLIRTAAEDDAPRVRLEAVRACSFFRDWEAADVALLALKKPLDYYLDYTLTETLTQLEQWWRPAIQNGKPLASGNPAGIARVLGDVSLAGLAKLPQTESVLEAILARPDADAGMRAHALDQLAKLKDSSPAAELLGILSLSPAEELADLLPRQPRAALAANRAAIEKLLGHSSPRTRAAARAALMTIDDAVDGQWSACAADPGRLDDFLRAVPLLADTRLRASAYPKVVQVVRGLPKALTEKIEANRAPLARRVRIELPRKGTLTLAEVEVISDNENVALHKPAQQSSVAYNGQASRAVDGNTSGRYGDEGQTHTREEVENQWWEVDLGADYPVERVRIFNRTEQEFYKRLEGFSLILTDSGGREVFRKSGIPATREPMEITLGSDMANRLQRRAIAALVSTGEQPARLFSDLARVVHSGADPVAAAAEMAKLPREAWNKQAAAAVVKGLLAWAREVPVANRTGESYLATMRAASELSEVLPADQASAARREISKLGVSMFVIKTLPEKMQYDTTRVVVQAGRPFEILFENDDGMPHNLVVVKPGTREKVGNLAQSMPPPAEGSDTLAYVPAESQDVLAATHLLNPGQRESLHLTAPETEGEYEFVCTFPGHWMVMWGRIIVTKDVEAYLKAHPEP